MQLVCPHGAGAKNFLPAAYIATRRVIVVPLNEACMDLFPVPGGGTGGLSSGVNWGIRPRPDDDGNYGRLQAIDLATRETVWTTRQRAPQTSGVLATAGELVFAAAFDRGFRAYDARNGRQLVGNALERRLELEPDQLCRRRQAVRRDRRRRRRLPRAQLRAARAGVPQPAESRRDALGVLAARLAGRVGSPSAANTGAGFFRIVVYPAPELSVD